VLRQRYENMPSLLGLAMVDSLGAGTLAKELAQRALCMFHDLNTGQQTASELPNLPAPWPSERDFSKEAAKKFWASIPWWVYAGGAFVVLNWLQNNAPRGRR